MRFPATLTPTQFLLGAFVLALAIVCSIHAILRRRNPHAVLWWLAVFWTLPVAGAFLYWFFGINRIERKAAWLRRDTPPKPASPLLVRSDADDQRFERSEFEHLAMLRRIGDTVLDLPLTGGNAIEPLFGGDAAFPAMLSAIDRARKSIGLSTYIFENDIVGKRFIQALARARSRGVEVRVLIDDIGSGFHWQSVHRELAAMSIPVAYFMPTFIPWRLSYFNLRNHRKILTIDGEIAFSGGMNITKDHSDAVRSKTPAEDVHFSVRGPVVAQIQEAFRSDWHFTTGETLSGDAWFPTLTSVGSVVARTVADGPDEDLGKCKLMLLGALSNAKQRIRIMTPYLIPDQSMVTTLNLAALSGVQVDIVFPERNDFAIISWATQAYLWQLLERGVRIWRTPAPFNHAKLMVVDGCWALFGSSNWDPRSLRLNFELNVECYGQDLARGIEAFIDKKIQDAHQVTLREIDRRPFPMKLRDGVARLFSPIL